MEIIRKNMGTWGVYEDITRDRDGWKEIIQVTGPACMG